VNGEDVALRSGNGWTYDVSNYALSVTNDGCVVSGTNMSGTVFLNCASDVALTISNLFLLSSATLSPQIDIASNVTVTLTLVGENEFISAVSSVPAIHVPYSATLIITNIDSKWPSPTLMT
jgi:hypothetical protein